MKKRSLYADGSRKVDMNACLVVNNLKSSAGVIYVRLGVLP